MVSKAMVAGGVLLAAFTMLTGCQTPSRSPTTGLAAQRKGPVYPPPMPLGTAGGITPASNVVTPPAGAVPTPTPTQSTSNIRMTQPIPPPGPINQVAPMSGPQPMPPPLPPMAPIPNANPFGPGPTNPGQAEPGFPGPDPTIVPPPPPSPALIR